MANPTPAPRWMKIALQLAGLYNLLWGAWVVLFPMQYFDWLAMPRPNYPSIWQAVGMIVGVYGLGYYVAAYRPAQHWPIVLVGFLGKLFGPIGLLFELYRGGLPLRFAWVNLTNDVIWLVPFALILRFAWQQRGQ